MSSFISVKVSPTEYKHFKVDKEVMTYIIQLENAVKDENVKHKLVKLYPKLK